MKVKVLVQQIMKGSENIKENMDHVWRSSCSISIAPLGTGDATKTNEFSEKFHAAFDSPPLIFPASYRAPVLHDPQTGLGFTSNLPSGAPL